MRSWHVVQEVIVKSKNGIIRVRDEIVTKTNGQLDLTFFTKEGRNYGQLNFNV